MILLCKQIYNCLILNKSVDISPLFLDVTVGSSSATCFLIVAGLMGLTNLLPYTSNANKLQGQKLKITGPSAYRLIVSHPKSSLIIDALQADNSDEFIQHNYIQKNGNNNEIKIYKDVYGKLYIEGNAYGGTIISIFPYIDSNPLMLEKVDSVSDLERVF